MKPERHPSGVLVLQPTGPRLDAETCDPLKEALFEQISDGEHQLCLDLQQVESMDSSGLGVLIGAIRQVAGRGEIRLTHVRPEIQNLLQMTNVGSLFRIMDSLEDDEDPTPSS